MTEVSDAAIVAVRRASNAHFNRHPIGVRDDCCIRAELEAAAPLVDVRARADERQRIADELAAFADVRRTAAYRYAPELDICARRSNDCVVNSYYVAASIARDGNPRNDNCLRCRDTKGGPVGHDTSECAWKPCNTSQSVEAAASNVELDTTKTEFDARFDAGQPVTVVGTSRAARYRTGTRVGRTIYRVTEVGEDLVGLLDTPELAAFAVAAMNREAGVVAGDPGE